MNSDLRIVTRENGSLLLKGTLKGNSLKLVMDELRKVHVNPKDIAIDIRIIIKK